MRHASETTRGLHCDGQPCFDVLLRRRKTKNIQAYWCNVMHSYINPESITADTCPRKDRK